MPNVRADDERDHAEEAFNAALGQDEEDPVDLVSDEVARGILMAAFAEYGLTREAVIEAARVIRRTAYIARDTCTRTHKAAGCQAVHACDTRNNVYCGNRLLST